MQISLNVQNDLFTMQETFRQTFSTVVYSNSKSCLGKNIRPFGFNFLPTDVRSSNIQSCNMLLCFVVTILFEVLKEFLKTFEPVYEFFLVASLSLFHKFFRPRHTIQVQFYDFHLLSEFNRDSPETSTVAITFLPLNYTNRTNNASFATFTFVWYHSLDFIPS
jgi:hypothetical protein